MKAKIGNIEIEGTPQEIKEFINSQETSFGVSSILGSTKKSSLVQQSPDIHSEHKSLLDKDYSKNHCCCSDYNPKCEKCVKDGGKVTE